jgi:hypothetical protein
MYGELFSLNLNQTVFIEGSSVGIEWKRNRLNLDNESVKKQNLPTKTCLVSKTFSWRKKWERFGMR